MTYDAWKTTPPQEPACPLCGGDLEGPDGQCRDCPWNAAAEAEAMEAARDRADDQRYAAMRDGDDAEIRAWNEREVDE
jgi:predicted ATP-dependent serine protease